MVLMLGEQAFNTHTTNVYNSSIFQEKAKEASSFFSELSPYVGGRALQLSNMVSFFCAKDPSLDSTYGGVQWNVRSTHSPEKHAYEHQP